MTASMPNSRREGPNEPVVDDYPANSNSENQDERIPRYTTNGQNRAFILFSLVYFLNGCGLGIYGPLYPELARKNGLTVWVYGLSMATSHLISVLFYPVACRIVSEVSSRYSVTVSVFLIGGCRILFGTLNLIPTEDIFIIISYGVQFVEGIGMAILYASTVITAGTSTRDHLWKLSLAVQSSFCLGLSLGPIGGQVLKDELGFDIVFYMIGGLTVLSSILTATLLLEPENQITYKDMPIVSWMKHKRMVIYFFITLATFTYVGFLNVSLEYFLKRFHLNSLYFSMIFSLSPFVFGITVSGWSWLIRKAFNNVMLVFIGSIAVIASLVLLGPAPFTSLQTSLTNVCLALVLEGLGVACKSTCVLDASEQDLRYPKKYTESQQKLIFPAVFLLGTASGSFFGSLIAAVMGYNRGYRTATLPLFAIEICTAIGAVIFAMNRNYVSKSRRNISGENQPILRS